MDTKSSRVIQSKIIHVDSSHGEAKARIYSDQNEEAGIQTALIGNLEAVTREDASRLLSESVRWCREQGFVRLIGPINGSTWNQYRLITWSSSFPLFPLEPRYPDWWPGVFREAGFSEGLKYSSKLEMKMHWPQERLGSQQIQAFEEQYVFRSPDMKNLNRDLAGLHRLIHKSFQRQSLFTPVSYEEFSRSILSGMQGADISWIQLACDPEGNIAGFIYTFPFDTVVEDSPRRYLIVKTLAVSPGRKYAGLGIMLLHRIYQACQPHSVIGVIHAFMSGENISQNLSSPGSLPIRQYSLYSRSLT